MNPQSGSSSNREPPSFRKILVANRGEIAVRVIHAIHALGATAVSVYSDVDKSGLHVLLSDEAYRIGPGPAAESYLSAEAILAAARNSGAEAVHPGYGFLSENADFAEAVRDAGLVFIGPRTETIRMMGDKVAAKRLMAAHGVPLIPGYDGDDQSRERFESEAAAIGYPVMLKATAGGGGRGMRVVEKPKDLPGALEAASREATAAFANGRLFLEKLVVNPRHIEVQVLGDEQGNIIHLFERDCSVQRRHQKVVEEAPSPALDDAQRQTICNAGLRAARAAQYVNAGTVEFLWSDGDYYFLEMNTRIQVEHGVTEMVTRKDLVRAQIEIAAGKPLPWNQEEVSLGGHAIEVRLYAEDPDHDFLPRFGRVTRFDTGTLSLDDWKDGFPEWERIDRGFVESTDISRFYDPLVAKIILRAETRAEAISDMQGFLKHIHLEGITNNLEFLRWITVNATFVSGHATTSFVETEWQGQAESFPETPADIVLAAAGLFLRDDERRVQIPKSGDLNPAAVNRPWHTIPGWRLGCQGIRLHLKVGGRFHRVEASKVAEGWQIGIGAQRFDRVGFVRITGDRYAGEALDSSILVVTRGHEAHHFRVHQTPSSTEIEAWRDNGGLRRPYAVELLSPFTLHQKANEDHPISNAARSGIVRSPMPGTVVNVTVSPGDRIEAHRALMVLEAMKMEHILEAPHGGMVTAVHHGAGDLVQAGDALVEIVDETSADSFPREP